MYKFKLWFEHGGQCLWGVDKLTREVYGHAVNYRLLNLSEKTIEKLIELTAKYRTYLDWNYPNNSTLWTKEEKADFIKESDELCQMLEHDMGDGFEIINEVKQSVGWNTEDSSPINKV